jgi:hypothetical protein
MSAKAPKPSVFLLNSKQVKSTGLRPLTLEIIMQDYTLTVISKTGHTHDFVVYAATLDAAIDKMLDKISYDVREIHTDDEIIIL